MFFELPRGYQRSVPQGISLHIGCNVFDRQSYGAASPPPLRGCVNDAVDMESIARTQGFRTRLLLDDQATSTAILDSISTAAQILQPGDFFWMTSSTHGVRVPDPLEVGGIGEAMVTYDRLVDDNTFWTKWAEFQPGVRICLLTDICFGRNLAREWIPTLMRLQTQQSRVLESGSQQRGDGVDVLQSLSSLSGRNALELALSFVGTTERLLATAGGGLSPAAAPTLVRQALDPILEEPRGGDEIEQNRMMDERLGELDVQQRRDMYRQTFTPSDQVPTVWATVLGVASTDVAQTASDGRPDPSGRQNGAYTRLLKQVWQSATSYRGLQEAIKTQMPGTQTPGLYWPNGYDASFDNQRPFTI
jgi:hypothetical protein